MKLRVWLGRLEGRFTLAAATAAVLPLLLVSVVAWYGLSRSYLSLAGARLDSEAARLEAVLDTRLQMIAAVLEQTLAAGEEPGRWSLWAAAARLPEVSALRLRRSDGEVDWSRFGLSAAPLPRVASKERRVTWGSVQRDDWGEPQISLGVSSGTGLLLDAWIRGPSLWDAIIELHQPHLHAYLIDSSGRRIASSDLVEVLRGRPPPKAVAGAPLGKVLRYRSAAGAEQLAVVRPVGGIGGRLVVEAPVASLLAPLRTALLLLFGAVLLALAASAWPGWRLARAVTRPLDELARGSAELAQSGGLAAPLAVSGPPEARTALSSFNQMAVELVRNRRQLEQHAAGLEQRVEERTEALRLALEKALAAERARARFLASVSHELRTPLANIKGFASTLLAPDVAWRPEDAREFLKIIESEADRMHLLVSDLLDLARSERGEFRITPAPTHPLSLLRELEPQLRRLAAGRRLRFELEKGLPCLELDAARMRSVFFNLVENAAKYSPAGLPITIGAAPRGGGVRFFVRDAGPGIPPSLRERVFEPFFRGDHGSSGTGLGLAIAKTVVEAHGGAIGIAENEDGAEVWFLLPAGGKDDG